MRGAAEGGGEYPSWWGIPTSPPANKRSSPEEASDENQTKRSKDSGNSGKEAQEERNKRSIKEDEDEPAESEKSWKKKKLNWLKKVSKIPGVVPVSRVHVVEIYSPDRVNKVAREYGMETGLSLDFITGWDFNKREDRELAEKYIREFYGLRPGSHQPILSTRIHGRLVALRAWIPYSYKRQFLCFFEMGPEHVFHVGLLISRPEGFHR